MNFLVNFNDYINLINYINESEGNTAQDQHQKDRNSVIKEEVSEENDINPLHEEYEEHYYSNKNDSPSPNRRSRDERNQHSDLKEYLQLDEDHEDETQENKVFDHNTPDKIYEVHRYNDDNRLNKYTELYQNQTSSNKNSAEKHIEESNINDLLFTGSNLSFATKSPDVCDTIQKDQNTVTIDSKQNDSINNSPANPSPKEEVKKVKYLRTLPNYEPKYANKEKSSVVLFQPKSNSKYIKSKLIHTQTYTSPKAKPKTSEELKVSAKKEAQEVKEAKNEFDNYLQFLVTKYEELDDKSEVEDLILELNRISKDNKGIIPQYFKIKLEKFSKKCARPVTSKRLESHTVSTNQIAKSVKSKGSVKPTTHRTQSRKVLELKDDIQEQPVEANYGQDTLSDFIRVIQNNAELMGEYEDLVREYEESRVEVKAKTYMTFKSLSSPSKIDNYIGVVLLYYFYQIDNSILLRNDKRQLEDKSWNYIKNYFSSCGKIIINMKKILPFMEDKRINDSHFVEIKRYMELLNPTQVEALHKKNGVTGLLYNYCMACFNITKFLRSIYKIDEPPIVKKIPYNPPKPKPETRIINEDDMNLLISSKQNLFKVKLHSEIYNENLSAGFEYRQKEAEIKDTENRVKELKKLKSQIQWKEKRDRKQKEIEDRKKDEKVYRDYTEQLRKIAIELIEENLKSDKEFKAMRYNAKLKEDQISKLRSQILAKMDMLDEF